MITDGADKRSTHTPVKPWVRRRRILLLSVVAGLGFLILIVAVGRYISQRNYERSLEAIRAEGMPATIAELQEKQRQAGPAGAVAGRGEDAAAVSSPGAADDTTAAEIHQQEAKRLEQLWQNPISDEITDIVVRFQKEGGLSPEDLEKLRNYLTEYEDLLQALHNASELPPGAFPLDYSKGFAMEVPHLARLRQAAKLLLAEAVAAALDGDNDQAFEALVACAAVQRPLRGENLVISQLVRAACNGIAVGGLISTLGLTDFTDGQLAALQQAFQREHDRDAFTNALVTERVFALEAFEDPAAAFTEVGVGRSWMDEIIPGSYTVLIQTASALGWFARDREEYLQNISDMIAASRLSYVESHPLFEEIDARMDNESFLPSLNSLLLGGLSRMRESMAANDARLNMGSTAAAVERYRLATGSLPAQLSDLASAPVGGTPEDPFDEQPLRYRREGDGYVLYSVGPNGVDDGGIRGETWREGDVVFRRR